MNDHRLDVDRVLGDGVNEFNSNDWIATTDDGTRKVYHKNSGSGGGEAYSTLLRSAHPDNTDPATSDSIVEPVDVVVKCIPYATTPGAVASEQKIIHLKRSDGTISAGLSINAVRSSAGVTQFRLKLLQFTLGNVTVTAGTEYIIHYKMDDDMGVHVLEVFTTGGTLQGRVIFASNALKNILAAIDGCDVGASVFTNPSSGVVEHKIRDIYMLDHQTEFGQDWYGPDYAITFDQSFADSNVNWAVTGAGGETNQDTIDEWAQVTTDYNDSNDGTTNDLEDEFDIGNFPGSRTCRAVAIYTLSEAHLIARNHYVFIDDGTNHVRSPLINAGTGSAVDANEIIVFNLASDGALWTNAKYNSLKVGYEKFNLDNSMRWVRLATMVIFAIDAADYGADPRDRHINV